MTSADAEADRLDERRLQRARLWFYRVWGIIGVLGLIYLAWVVLREPIAIVIPPLVLAAAVVYLLNPLVRFLQRRGIPRLAGTAFAYFVLVGLITILTIYVGPDIADQIEDFASAVPEIAADVEEALNNQLARMGVEYRIPDLSPESGEVQEVLRRFFAGDSERLFAILSGAGSLLRQIFHLLVTLILGPILAFYLLVDLPRMGLGLRRLIPPDNRDEVAEVVTRIATTVGAYFRGMLMVAAFVGVATAIGCAIIGLPFWALVGVVAGVTNLVPLIGPFVGGAVGIIIALTAGDGSRQAVLVAIVMVIVQQIDNHIISPNIHARTVKVHPVTVMLGLLVAASMFGLFGMFVMVPLIATAKLVFLHVFTTRVPWAAEEAMAEGEAALAAAAERVSEAADALEDAAEEVAEEAADAAEDTERS